MGLEQFKVITDHKLLVPLINSRSLDIVPIRSHQLLMRLIRFNAVGEYAPGKTLLVTDTLSHSPSATMGEVGNADSEVVFYFAIVVV